MAYVPNGSAPHIVKSLNDTPVGTLADFSLDSSAIPFDPRDTSAQIPTLSATLADLAVPVNTLIDDDISLRDWSGSDTTANVKSVKGAATSGLTAIDTSTLFDRLNTAQTTFPIVLSESSGTGATAYALEHWCLMAGVTRYRTPGNLLQAIPTALVSSIGYLADNPAAIRSNGFDGGGGYTGFIPTIGTYYPSIEINPSQSVILGAMFPRTSQLSSFRINAWIPSIQQSVIYTVRRIDNTFAVLEKVGSAAETTLLTATYVPVLGYNNLSANLLVSANPSDPTKVNLTLRVIEGGFDDDVYTDFTATSVTSTLTKSPWPTQIDLGYDNALVGARTSYGGIKHYFMAEGSVLPEKFPVQQTTVNVPTTPEAQANDPRKVPGFTGNIWEKIKEFCAVTEMDVFFDQDSITFKSRHEQVWDGSVSLPPARLTKSDLSWSVDNRETSKYVDVLYREMVGDDNTYTSTELWRADTVYSLNKGEYKEEIVQTDATFTVLDQPSVVSGVPVPYTSAFGSYVITGNDGYIVDPQWWKDNGGYIRVEQTGTAGEIKINMQAPNVDTSRAPYRVSEGVADRPALYIKGSGLNLGKGKTLRLATGAGDAAQEAVTFDSPFITNLQMAYNAGYKVADSMGGAGGEISFGVPKATLATPDPSGAEYTTVPPGAMVYHAGAIHRITGMSMQPAGLSVSKATQFTSVAATNDGLGPDATVDDWNNLHAGKTVKEVNLAPLPQYLG